MKIHTLSTNCGMNEWKKETHTHEHTAYTNSSAQSFHSDNEAFTQPKSQNHFCCTFCRCFVMNADGRLENDNEQKWQMHIVHRKINVRFGALIAACSLLCLPCCFARDRCVCVCVWLFLAINFCFVLLFVRFCLQFRYYVNEIFYC